MTDFAKCVKAAAAEAGVSLSELERRCEYKPGALFMTLKANNPTIATGDRIAAALQLELWELLK